MRTVPRLCGFYPDICLITEEKAQINFRQGSRWVPAGTMKIYKRTIRIHIILFCAIFLSFLGFIIIMCSWVTLTKVVYRKFCKIVEGYAKFKTRPDYREFNRRWPPFLQPGEAKSAFKKTKTNSFQILNYLGANFQFVTYYFIVLLISSTCFGHYYARHQELATLMLITTLVVSFCKDQCGNQYYSRELLMTGIVVPETCWAYKKHNKIISGFQLVFYSSVITVMHGPTNIKFQFAIWFVMFISHIPVLPKLTTWNSVVQMA